MITIERASGIDYSKLPEHIRDGMRRYIEQGVEPGSFCIACLEDRLVSAFCAADDTNTRRMHDIVNWLYNDCPMPARGSKERVAAWIEQGGLNNSC